METKANHILIGAFTLLLVFMGLGFVAWFAKVEIDQEFNYYDIYFEESVSGLSVAGDVRYNGVPVGKVKTIELDPKNPSQVRVTVEVSKSTPVKVDSIAMLQFQGITGVSFVQLSGGTAGNPPPRAQEGERYPVIQSQTSPLEELFAGAPNLINRAIILVDSLSKIVDQKNRGNIATVLDNVAATSESVRNRVDEVESLLSQAEAMARELTETAEAITQLSNKAEITVDAATGIVDEDLRGLLREAREGAQGFRKLAGDVDKIVVDTGPAFADFSSEGLTQFTQLITEMRELVLSLSRISERIESDPAGFLFGNDGADFEATK